MFKPKLNTHPFRFKQLVGIENWNSWQVLFLEMLGKQKAIKNHHRRYLPDVIRCNTQNRSKWYFPKNEQILNLAILYQGTEDSFFSKKIPSGLLTGVRIEGLVRKCYYQLSSKRIKAQQKNHPPALSVSMLFLLVNLHRRQHVFVFSSQLAFYIQNIIILEGFMIYSFKLQSSLETSHQKIHAFKNPYFRSWGALFSGFWR